MNWRSEEIYRPQQMLINQSEFLFSLLNQIHSLHSLAYPYSKHTLTWLAAGTDALTRTLKRVRSVTCALMGHHPAAPTALSVCEMAWKRAKIISGEEFEVDPKPPRWAKWSPVESPKIWPKNMHRQDWLVGFSLRQCGGALSWLLPDVLHRLWTDAYKHSNAFKLTYSAEARPEIGLSPPPFPCLLHQPFLPLQKYPVTCWIYFGL